MTTARQSPERDVVHFCDAMRLSVEMASCLESDIQAIVQKFEDSLADHPLHSGR